MWKERGGRPFFLNRLQAGELLAEELERRSLKDPTVLGIPRGGVPIAAAIAKRLSCPIEVVVLRKLPLPWSPEAGFGAVTLDRTLILNEPMVKSLGLRREEIERIAQEVYQEVLRRDRIYRGERPFPDLCGRTAILCDDGLATGYTMLAAVEFVRKKGPVRIVVASPVASETAVKVLAPHVDELVLLHVSCALRFAVADFYEDFSEMGDEEVVEILLKFQRGGVWCQGSSLSN